MRGILRMTAATIALFAGAGSEAQAAKGGPTAKPSATTTTFTGFSTAGSMSGCSRSTDPTTNCAHGGVGTAAGVLGGNAGWTAWANLPAPGVIPSTASGNAFGYGYGYVSYKVPSGTTALEITSRLTVRDELKTSFEGDGFGLSALYSEFSPAGCSQDDCASEVRRTVTRSGALPSTDLGVPTSMVGGSEVTMTQTVAAPAGQTLPAGTSRLRVDFIHFAGSPQTPGHAGASAGTLKLDSIAITRR